MSKQRRVHVTHGKRIRERNQISIRMVSVAGQPSRSAVVDKLDVTAVCINRQ